MPHVVVIDVAARKPGVIGWVLTGFDEGVHVGEVHGLLAAVILMPEIGICQAHPEEEYKDAGENYFADDDFRSLLFQEMHESLPRAAENPGANRCKQCDS